jgi:hypothetical protein
MTRALALADLQRWMQAVVVHPGGLRAALASPQARAALRRRAVGDVVRPSRTLSPAERVGIYHGMYLLRMEEALQADYPGLAHFLGPAAFRALVRAYVQEFPSRSYTLNRLGDHLPDFVARARVRRRAFAHDLARLEAAMTRVFDAEEAPALTPAAVAAEPPEAWERARLAPIPAFELIALRHNAGEWLDSVDEAETRHAHPAPRRRAEWAAVYRSGYAVYRLPLSESAYALLADLARGRPLGRAVSAALRRRARPRPDADILFRWFRDWVARGIFRARA